MRDDKSYEPAGKAEQEELDSGGNGSASEKERSCSSELFSQPVPGPTHEQWAQEQPSWSQTGSRLP